MKKLLILPLLFLSLSLFSQKATTQLALGGSITGGNFNSFSTLTEISITRDTSFRNNWSINSSFIYGMIKDPDEGYKVYQRESYLLASFSRRHGIFRTQCFTEIENSFLKKILLRGSIGAGFGAEVIRKGKHYLLISEMVMPDTYYSEIDNDKNIVSVRLSTRIRYDYKGKIEITSITFIQPSVYSTQRVGFENNINSRSTNSITIPLNKRLSLGTVVSFNLSTYSSYIDNDVRPFDWNSSLLFKCKF